MDLRSWWKVLRGGNLRVRFSALRETRPALRLATTGAALDTGVLDALDSERELDSLADQLGFANRELLGAFLETLIVGGLVRRTRDRYQRTARGSAIAADRVARSTYVAFADFHTGLYRDLPTQLTGGSGRADVTRRAEIRAGDVREVLDDDERFDVVLLANVIYYWPLAERVELFTALAQRLSSGGQMIVVTTALTNEHFARHFDLLLRAQRGRMELPDLEVLRRQVEEAGLVVRSERRLTAAEPLYALVATVDSG